MQHADRFYALFRQEAHAIEHVRNEDFNRLRDAYRGMATDVAHPDPNVERAAVGIHHDSHELYAHTAGYLYQRHVRERLLRGGLPVFAGSSNRVDPDIIIAPHAGGSTAIEVKTTATASMNASITLAVGQLMLRQGYQHGQMYVRSMDYDTIVRRAPAEDPFALMEGALGQHVRALRLRGYQTITGIVEIGTPPQEFARATWDVQADGSVVRRP